MNIGGVKLSRHALWLVAAVAALVMLALAGGNGAQSGASSEERRIAEVLGAVAGAGKVEVALFYGGGQESAMGAAKSAKPTGAVVVAQGAGDMAVRLRLIRAVRTLLGLPETAVDVFEMEVERR